MRSALVECFVQFRMSADNLHDYTFKVIIRIIKFVTLKNYYCIASVENLYPWKICGFFESIQWNIQFNSSFSTLLWLLNRETTKQRVTVFLINFISITCYTEWDDFKLPQCTSALCNLCGNYLHILTMIKK